MTTSLSDQQLYRAADLVATTAVNEAALMREIMLALSAAGHTVFRANVGLFFTRDGRPVRSGLPNGFSDLFGFTADLRPYFIEVKTRTGRASPEQRAFIDAMRARGAVAGICRTVDEVLRLLQR